MLSPESSTTATGSEPPDGTMATDTLPAICHIRTQLSLEFTEDTWG
jgi:hypothetical protein